MKALAVPEFGASPRLMELTKPKPGLGELLVRLSAGSLNPFDRAIAEGFMRQLRHVFPLVLGLDGAGVVVEVGDEVEAFEVGDVVFGACMHEPLGRGTLAEYAVVPEGALIHKLPPQVSQIQAAAAPGAGMTALGLIETAAVSADEVVLIVGATGGVGSFAVQLAAQAGARVLATARPDAADQVKRLGAKASVDYSDGPIGEPVSALAADGLDVLLDLMSGSDAFVANAALVRDGGRAVSLRYAATPELLESERIRVANFSAREQSRPETLLVELADQLEAGRLEVVVDREVPLAEAPELYTSRLRGGSRGKAVVVI